MAKKIPLRSEVSEQDKWDLSPLFKTDSEWEKLFSEIESDLSKADQYRGRLHENLNLFKEAFDFNLDISRRIERLYTYAHLKSDEDKSNQQHLGIYQKAINLYTRISETLSFMTPEIQSIPDDIINGFIKDESMKDYRFDIEKIIRFKPHTRGEETEQVMAMMGEVSGAPSQIFSQLDNVDLKFGTLADDTGAEMELSHGNFSSFLISQNRDVRKNAFMQYYAEYKDHKNTIAAALSSSVKKDLFYSKARKFETCRRSALFGDNVPDEVYDNLITAVRSNLPALFKYLNFRKSKLGVDSLHFYDTYVPLVDDVNFKMGYDEAADICVKCLAPLGEEYTGILRDGFDSGWVDRYENKGKRSGAYSSGCYDSPPYILMNYDENNINSLYTLIHEAGHSMHSYYSKKNQPYISHDYTIFVAEVASTFNETLLSKYLLEKYRDDSRMKAYILNREIDNIRGTLYRQTMFAEYELAIHAHAEKNSPLTLETLTEIYNSLLKDYFGSAMVVDEELTLECLRIPHFYSAFYVYKYATGISAAISLAEKVLSQGNAARDRYLNFLKLGGSKYPIDELVDAGVDMRSPEPVNDALKHFASIVDELIAMMG
jgi:oligoendopeptidase F